MTEPQNELLLLRTEINKLISDVQSLGQQTKELTQATVNFVMKDQVVKILERIDSLEESGRTTQSLLGVVQMTLGGLSVRIQALEDPVEIEEAVLDGDNS